MNGRIESPIISGVVNNGQRQGVPDVQVGYRVLLLDARMKATARPITGGTFVSATRRGGLMRRDQRGAHRGSATLIALG
jgi:hypothetical protein